MSLHLLSRPELYIKFIHCAKALRRTAKRWTTVWWSKLRTCGMRPHALSLKGSPNPDQSQLYYTSTIYYTSRMSRITNSPYSKPFRDDYGLATIVTTTGAVSMLIKILCLKCVTHSLRSICLSKNLKNMCFCGKYCLTMGWVFVARWTSARGCGGMFKSAFKPALCFSDSLEPWSRHDLHFEFSLQQNVSVWHERGHLK